MRKVNNFRRVQFSGVKKTERTDSGIFKYNITCYGNIGRNSY